MESKPTILVIEDDRPIRSFIGVSLSVEGYTCLEANTGKLGISMIASFKVGALEIDYVKRKVMLDENEVHLTPMEYNLLLLMARHAGKVLTHHFILKEVWGVYTENDTRSLRVFMANMRRKIEKEPARPRYILTEVGVGYRLADE